MTEMISGVRGNSLVATTFLPLDISKAISLLEPNKAALTTLLVNMKGKMEEADNYKFWWNEDVLNPREDAVNFAAGYSAAATSIVVDNAGYFRAGDIIRFPRTGEVASVTTATVATNTLVIVRSWGSTAAAILVDDEPIQILANAAEQGATKGTGRSTVKEGLYGYCQLIRSHPFGVTGTLGATKTVTGAKDGGKAWERRKKLIEQWVQIEQAIIFGERGYDTSGTHPRATTAGVMENITTNVYNAGGTLTEANFNKSFCEGLFKYDEKPKLLLCGARLISIINMWGVNKLQTVPSDKVYGLRLLRYISAHGELLIKKHHLFQGATLQGTGVALDMSTLKLKYMGNGRKLLLKKNVQANGEDAELDEFTSEVGLEHRQEEKSAKIYNVGN